jgi:DNA-binding transcriptional MocR family regulator
MLELPERMDEDAAVAEAAHRSIRVYGARSYHARPDCARPALLIGYGGLPESRIRPAVAQLAEAFAKGDWRVVHVPDGARANSASASANP